MSLLVFCLPDLSVLCESGHGSALCVVLRQAGADLQHVRLPWLGNHHGVVKWSRYGGLVLGLRLLRLLRLGLRLGLGLGLGLTLGLERGNEGKEGHDVSSYSALKKCWLPFARDHISICLI